MRSKAVSPKPVRVVIGMRYTLFREGVKTMLLRGRSIDVTGEARTAKQTISLVERLKPDVVLIDTDMPDLEPLETVRRIRASNPEVKVFVMPLGDAYPVRSGYRRAGADGYIGKHERPVELRSVVLHSVHRRGVHAL
jgi:DNA-binding NarL/FixJ family response regulator